MQRSGVRSPRRPPVPFSTIHVRVSGTWQERIRRYLLPGKVEDDPEFRAEIERLSHIGLYVVGAVEVVVTIFIVTAQLTLEPNAELRPWRLILGACVIALGIVTLALARVLPMRRFSRPLAALSGAATAAIITWILLRMTEFDPTSDDVIPGSITLITLVAVAAIPLRPTDTLLFGFVTGSMYVVLALAAQELLNIGAGVDQITVLFLFMLTCLAAALTAVLYDQRRSAWEWHRHSVETLANLQQAETRNLLSQNAASVGRLAAAVSHELNSPIGDHATRGAAETCRSAERSPKIDPAIDGPAKRNRGANAAFHEPRQTRNSGREHQRYRHRRHRARAAAL
jgi:hypothetical protein